MRVEQLSHMADKSRAELTARIETSLGAQEDRLKGGLEMVHAAGQHMAEQLEHSCTERIEFRVFLENFQASLAPTRVAGDEDGYQSLEEGHSASEDDDPRRPRVVNRSSPSPARPGRQDTRESDYRGSVFGVT